MIYQPTHYRSLLDLNPSRSNQIDFCLGTIGEMSDGDVYDAVDQQSSQGRIAYVHFRNVRGQGARTIARRSSMRATPT